MGGLECLTFFTGFEISYSEDELLERGASEYSLGLLGMYLPMIIHTFPFMLQ